MALEKSYRPTIPESMAEASMDFAEKNFSNIKGNLRKMMMEKYSWDVNVEKLAKIYEEII